MSRALITGIGGQDGSYLAELLHEKGYEVYGLIHEGHTDSAQVAQRLPFVRKIYGNLIDMSSLTRAYEEARPDEIYNLGSLSAVDLSFSAPFATLQITGIGVLNALEAFRISGCASRQSRFYQASSAEMFGNAGPGPYSELTPLSPQSPYAAAKALGHHLVTIYRQSYGLYAATGICFNHESPRRGTHFVSRKISLAVARISQGLQSKLTLGNLDARRDWGYAGDYVKAMWLSLQQPQGDDFVISTGESHTVREFVELAFGYAGISDWSRYVDQDPQYFRPLDVPELKGDSSKARAILGWKPTVGFRDLVNMMVEADVSYVTRGR